MGAMKLPLKFCQDLKSNILIIMKVALYWVGGGGGPKSVLCQTHLRLSLGCIDI